MAAAISSGRNIWSTAPVRIALSGMPLNCAVSVVSQNTVPPALPIS